MLPIQNGNPEKPMLIDRKKIIEGVAIAALTTVTLSVLGAIKGDSIIRFAGGATEQELAARLSSLGKARDGDTYEIDSDLAPKQDRAQCPPGSFVSSISVSQAARSKYAAHAVAELTVVCSPVQGR
jgi:hypothetical protein